MTRVAHAAHGAPVVRAARPEETWGRLVTLHRIRGKVDSIERRLAGDR